MELAGLGEEGLEVLSDDGVQDALLGSAGAVGRRQGRAGGARVALVGDGGQWRIMALRIAPAAGRVSMPGPCPSAVHRSRSTESGGGALWSGIIQSWGQSNASIGCLQEHGAAIGTGQVLVEMSDNRLREKIWKAKGWTFPTKAPLS